MNEVETTVEQKWEVNGFSVTKTTYPSGKVYYKTWDKGVEENEYSMSGYLKGSASRLLDIIALLQGILAEPQPAPMPLPPARTHTFQRLDGTPFLKKTPEFSRWQRFCLWMAGIES